MGMQLDRLEHVELTYSTEPCKRAWVTSLWCVQAEVDQSGLQTRPPC